MGWSRPLVPCEAPPSSPAQHPYRYDWPLLRVRPQGFAPPLVLVEHAIDHLVGHLPVLARPPCGEPHADLDRLRRSRGQAGLDHRGAQPRHDIISMSTVGFRHRQAKLMPTDTRADN